MEKELIRLLRANEIECRISTISEKGLSLLLYKDARVDQRILDETFGPFGWKRSHQCIDGNLYCTVEIYDMESGCWVSKQDVGTMGFAEKEKSQASDSFKRACFNWGIGRELYSAPFIWIPAGKVEIQRKDNKLQCYERFSVQFIEYTGEREIAALIIVNEKGQVMYEMKAKKQSTDRGQNIAKEQSTTKEQGAAKGQRVAKEQGAANGENTTRNQGSAKEQSITKGQKMTAEQRTVGQQDTDIHQKTSEKDGAIISSAQRNSLEAELQRTGVGMDAVMQRYQIDEPEQISQELYDRVMQALAKTKTVQAA